MPLLGHNPVDSWLLKFRVDFSPRFLLWAICLWPPHDGGCGQWGHLGVYCLTEGSCDADWGLCKPLWISEGWLAPDFLGLREMVLTVQLFQLFQLLFQEVENIWGMPAWSPSPPWTAAHFTLRIQTVWVKPLSWTPEQSPLHTPSFILETCWWFTILKMTQMISRTWHDWAKQKNQCRLNFPLRCLDTCKHRIKVLF